MQSRSLGSSGLTVSAIGMGAMPLSIGPNRPTEVDAIAVIHHAVACGVTLIDTADSYCIDDSEVGHNERLIGRALAGLDPSTRDRILVATKGGCLRPGGRWETDGRPEHLRLVCEQSLENLRVDRIDLYQLHAPDPGVPLAQSLGALKRLKDEGKIAHVGVSNFTADQIDQAQRIVEIVSVQNRFSPACRDPERDGTLAATQQRGLAFLPWSPLTGMRGAKTLGEHQPIVQSIAADHGVSTHQVALAWLLAKGPMVIPIPGASRTSTIEDSAKAADLVLSAEELRLLDEAWP